MDNQEINRRLGLRLAFAVSCGFDDAEKVALAWPRAEGDLLRWDIHGAYRLDSRAFDACNDAAEWANSVLCARLKTDHVAVNPNPLEESTIPAMRFHHA